MFTKIAKPLLEGESTLHLVVCRENDTELRVSVHVMDPKPDAGAKESALSRPVTIVDTPENLDATLGEQLANYQAARQEAHSSIAEVAPSKSNSVHSARRSSPLRTKVNAVSCSAARTTRLPS